MQRIYETIYVTKSDLPETTFDSLNSKIKNLITTGGGEIGHEESWGIRQLSYKIDKYNMGKYHYLAYKSDPKAITELEFQLKIHEGVLTYMTVRMNDKVTLETISKPDPRELNLG